MNLGVHTRVAAQKRRLAKEGNLSRGGGTDRAGVIGDREHGLTRSGIFNAAPGLARKRTVSKRVDTRQQNGISTRRNRTRHRSG